MFDQIKRDLYFKKARLLLQKGILEGNITSFSDEFYEKMNHTYISCLPVSMHIKYLKPILPPGKCYDRSLYMFFCFEDSLLVRGDNKDLELRFGKDKAGHGWIEMDGYCYDPSLRLKFKKETYYDICKPSNMVKTTLDEYKNYSELNKKFYEEIVNTEISDFQPGGKRRVDLINVIPLIRGISDIGNDNNLKEELDSYLNLIQYDEEEILEEMNRGIEKALGKK